MTHGAMLWGAALYNNGAYPFKNDQFGEFYTRDGEPGKRLSRSAADAARHVAPRAPAVPGAALPLGSVAAGQRAPHLRATADAEPLEHRHSRSGGGAGTARRTLQQPRLRHAEPHRPGVHRPAEDAPVRPDAELLRHQRSAGRLPLERLHGLPRRLRERPRRPSHRPATRAPATRDARRPSDPTIPKRRVRAIRSRTRSRTAIPTSQCMVCHMHPGTNMVDQLSRLHVVGQRDRRREDVSREARSTSDRRSAPSDREPQPRRQRRARALGRPAVPRKTGTPEFNTQLRAHAVRRLPRPRLGLRAVFKHDRKGNLLDTQDEPVRDARRRAQRGVNYRTASRGRRRADAQQLTPHTDAPTVRAAGPPEGHPPRAGACTASTATSSRTPRRRQAVRRDAQRRRDRLRRLPRHGRRSARRCAPPARGREPRRHERLADGPAARPRAQPRFDAPRAAKRL